MKIEAWDLLTNSWKLCHENVNNEVGDLVVGVPNNQSGGMNKIRYTFRDFANLSNLRISQLFLVNYISEMGAGPFLPRGGGQIYGPILAPYPTAGNQLARKDYVDDTVNALKREQIHYVQARGTRAVGLGGLPEGYEMQYSITLTSVKYRIGTEDGSGFTVCELRKNGVTIPATVGTGSTSPVAVTGSWSFNAGDVLTVHVNSVGSEPGDRLTAYILGTK